jgi:hypothetical protein
MLSSAMTVSMVAVFFLPEYFQGLFALDALMWANFPYLAKAKLGLPTIF